MKLTTLSVHNAHSKIEQIDISHWSEEFVLDLLTQGFDIRVQRAAAKVDKDLPEPTKKAKIIEAKLEVFTKLCQGIIPQGGGSRGPHLDAVSKGWIAYFAAINHKEADKSVSRKTLDRAINTYCRQVLIAANPPGTDLRRNIEANIGEYVAKHRDSIIEAAETSPDFDAPGVFIAIEHTRKAALQAATQVASSGPMLKGFKIGPSEQSSEPSQDSTPPKASKPSRKKANPAA